MPRIQHHAFTNSTTFYGTTVASGASIGTTLTIPHAPKNACLSFGHSGTTIPDGFIFCGHNITTSQIHFDIFNGNAAAQKTKNIHIIALSWPINSI